MGTGARRDRTTRLLLTAAILCLLGGLSVGGATAWGWWGRVRAVQDAQQRLTREWIGGTPPAAGTPQPDGRTAAGARGRRPPAAMPFDGAVDQGEPGTGDVPAGTAIARLYLPTLQLTFVVVEGAGDQELMLGPGHITGTAPFGEPGNAGIAGHRYPGVFWNLDRLQVSSPVVVETRDVWLVYRVIDATVVSPEQNSVLDAPAPGAGPLLTLVTCDPKLSTARRLIRQATLIRRDARTGPQPPELG